ncbi:MAG: trehalase family glycosidase [Actinomycetota bacterium]|nr:trehalase family glycosidase [Actinomycetota bacterium]
MRGDSLPSGPLGEEEWKKIVNESTRVFALNEVDQGEIYYHMPSIHHYPSLFAWDSGFHAAAMSNLDVSKAARELETLFRQTRDDGRMPHEVLMPNRASRRFSRRLQTWLVRWEYDGDGASFMVDPPSYHFAAEIVYRRSGDGDWLRRLWPRMRGCLDYLLVTRDVKGDGLVTIFHPWESGTDMSPQFFQAMDLHANRRRDVVRAALYTTALFAINSLKGWDIRRLTRAGGFACEELTMNCLTIRACRSMAYMAGELGRREEEARYRGRAESMMEALDRLCWDEEQGCYFPRFGIGETCLARRRTADSLMPLFTGICPRDRACRLVEEHLLDRGEFWNEYLVPFNPEDELAGACSWVDKRLWAGHCIWINFCWMLAIGLGEYGYTEEATEVTRRVVHMILREGFYEFYDSRTGEGRRIAEFCWPALALDMMYRFWPRAH